MDIQENTTTSQAFGNELENARKSRGLSLSDCAKSVKIPRAVLSKLEKGDYTNFATGPYLRNYLASYGKYLGVDDADLKAVLKQATDARETKLVAAPKGVSTSAGGFKKGMIRLTYLIVALVIIAPLVWFGIDNGKNLDFGGDSTADVIESQATPDPDAAKVTDKAQDSARQSASASSQTAHADDISVLNTDGNLHLDNEIDSQGQADMVSSANTESSQGVADIDDDIFSKVNANSSQDAVEDGKANTETNRQGEKAAQAKDEAAVQARFVLRIDLDDDSWADIHTSSGKRLAYTVLPSGDSYTYESDDPLVVTLGNAAGAHVSLNGEHIDLTSYRRNAVARFNVVDNDGKATIRSR